jgi:hypothetical protein
MERGLDGGSHSLSLPDSSKRRIDAVIDVTANDGASLHFELKSGKIPSCFLIDDAIVYRVK